MSLNHNLKQFDGQDFPIVSSRRNPDLQEMLYLTVHVSNIIPIRTQNPLANERRFDSNALGFLNRDDHHRLCGEDLHCNCFICQGLTIDQFYDTYGRKDGHYSKSNLRLHQTVHELYASHLEFQSAQQMLTEESYREYLQEKPVVQRYLLGEPEFTISTSLDNFF